MYNKASLGVVDFCSKDKNNPVLNSVFFDKNITVATDGYMMMVVENDKTIKNEDFPETNNELGSIEGKMMRAEDVKEVIKSIPKKQSMPILNYAAPIKTEDDKVGLVTTNLEIENTKIARTVEGEYPNYKKIMDNHKTPKATVRLNARLLRTVCDYFCKYALENNEYIDIEVGTELDPVRFGGTTVEGQKINGLIMPVRGG